MDNSALSLKESDLEAPPAAAGMPGKVSGRPSAPSLAQKRYLSLGLGQPGGKLPLFDRTGQRIPARTIRACMSAGWCDPWYANPVEPKWLVCKLTEDGRAVASDS